MNEAHDHALPASKKLHMMYVLSAEAMSELRDILVDRSVWVPHPDDGENIGFTHKDDLAQVAWSFDCVLATLSLIEDGAWDEQHRDQVPHDLLAHLQQAASRSGSDWIHERTLADVRRVHERVLDTARLQHSPADAFHPVGERLMYALCSDVSADVKLTHCAGVKVTHLSDDGGLLAVDVDPGASSGDTCDGPQGRGDQGDREAAWLLAQHRAAVLA